LSNFCGMWIKLFSGDNHTNQCSWRCSHDWKKHLCLCTTSLTFNNSTFCPHSVFMCFVWIWEQTAIISLHNINWLVFITETESVYCAVRWYKPAISLSVSQTRHRRCRLSLMQRLKTSQTDRHSDRTSQAGPEGLMHARATIRQWNLPHESPPLSCVDIKMKQYRCSWISTFGFSTFRDWSRRTRMRPRGLVSDPTIQINIQRVIFLDSNFLLKSIIIYSNIRMNRAGIAQSVLRPATGWTIRRSNSGGGEIFRTRPDRLWGPHILLYNGYRVIPGDKAAGAWRWPPTPI
jgi:hypothetical protein